MRNWQLLITVLVVCAANAHAGQSASGTRAHELYLRGVALEHGEGAEQDPVRAAALYCEAAQHGHAEAMFALGWMYANGRGLERNDAYASGMFKRAAKRGHEHAEKMLRFTGNAGKDPTCMQRPSIAAGAPRSIDQLLARLPPERQKIAKLVVELAPDYQIDPSFALAIAITESALNPRALSPKNAMGVMQLIPDTAARFNVTDAYDPRQNIIGGLSYLRWLLAYFEGDTVFAAAAYNAGEGAVERYQGVPPFRETQAYVKRILRLFDGRRHAFDNTIVSPSRRMPALRIAEQLPGS